MQCLEACLQPPKKGKKIIRGPPKRLAVSAEAGGDVDVDVANAPRKTVQKSDKVREQILQITQGKTLFAGCTLEQREAVVDAMFEVTCAKDEVVIQEGDMGECVL